MPVYPARSGGIVKGNFAGLGDVEAGGSVFADDLGNHALYNVAKSSLEFSISIERTKLRPDYGDGFQGAPLQSAQIKTTQDQSE